MDAKPTELTPYVRIENLVVDGLAVAHDRKTVTLDLPDAWVLWLYIHIRALEESGYKHDLLELTLPSIAVHLRQALIGSSDAMFSLVHQLSDFAEMDATNTARAKIDADDIPF